MKKPQLQWNKGEREAFEDFVRGHVDGVLQCANLSHFQISDLKQKRGDGMEIETEYDYLEFTLGYGTQWAITHWRAENYDHLISFICHELTHIVVQEIQYHVTMKENPDNRIWFERVTEHTSRWLYRLYQQSK